jgi:clorobiocin biosynthesis protein CloN5
MLQDDLINPLKHYLSTEVLDGSDIGLEEQTPLLEWGVLNSFEIMRLCNFIHQRFGVDVPADKMIAQNFINLTTIATMISSLREKQTPELS